MTQAPTRCIREWEELRIGDDGFSERDAKPLHRVAERAARRLRLPEHAILTRTATGVRAGQVVGVLATPGPTLEILPKIDGDDGAVRAALVRMLAVALELRVADGEITALHTQRHDLLELLIRLFTARLLAAVRRGLPRRYQARTQDLKLMRGRLDVIRQLTQLAVRSDVLACRFDELSADTPLNRVLKAAVSMLTGVTRSAATARCLAELVARFERVSGTRTPLREPVRLDRSNTAFHDLYRLARMFLAGDWQSAASGRASGFALVFAMNDLFEAFIGRSVRRAVGSLQVHLQHAKHYAIEGQDGPLFRLKPDIVVETPDGPMVLDTKWKQLDPGDKTLKIESTDIYQMHAYARAYDATRVVLVYPWCQELSARPGISRHWRIYGNPTHPGCRDRRRRPPRRSRRVAATDRRSYVVGSWSSRGAVGRGRFAPLSAPVAILRRESSVPTHHVQADRPRP